MEKGGGGGGGGILTESCATKGAPFTLCLHLHFAHYKVLNGSLENAVF